MTTEDKIRANAQLVLEGLGEASDLGEEFGYNRESVEWVEGYIERQRKRGGTKQEIESLVQVIGSFLGECIVHTYGGKWREYEGQMGIVFSEGMPTDAPVEEMTQTEEELLSGGSTLHAVFPFSKVAKQFRQGREAGESILGFFDLIGPMAKGPRIKRFH